MIDEIGFQVGDNGVGEIILNRPQKHNAITPEMADAIRDLRRRINDDEAVRAVVVRGSGERAFCAGTDLNSLSHYRDAWTFRNRVCYATEFRRIRKPTIAALKGWTIGGGFEIAINCDIRIASPSAKFGMPEVKHGWLGAGGSTQLLTRLVGYGRAMMICLTGETFDSAEADRLGIIERCVGDGEEEDAAREMAALIASHTLLATMTVKEGIRAAMTGSLDVGARYENDLMTLAFALGNQHDGVDRFNKRKDR